MACQEGCKLMADKRRATCLDVRDKRKGFIVRKTVQGQRKTGTYKGSQSRGKEGDGVRKG